MTKIHPLLQEIEYISPLAISILLSGQSDCGILLKDGDAAIDILKCAFLTIN